ncbi:DUF6057 family protein [Prevotella sp. RM4]|uniref:DUF6057 family protein n=1 Tax=Prevotella sp. RM4 TaxID=1200547 RepID=UPI00051B582A|nr:DUF6057 family protein [Prevotella sp. RM4]
MNIKSILPKAVLYVSLLAFFLFAVYIIYINQEVFYTAHDRSEFLFGEPFFHTLMSKPFGLMQYVGAWLTQFFYHPALGSIILVTIWVLIFFVGAKAFRLQNNASAVMLLPAACLLTSVVDLGYWIYISPVRGYWFSQSIGYLAMLLLLWVARCTPRKMYIVWYLLGFCLYPILGWFALLFILCLVVTVKPTWRELLGIVILIFTAAIWHTQFYCNLKFDDVVLAGLPRFETPLDSGEKLSIPFWCLGAVSVLISFYGRYLTKWFVPVVCVAIGFFFTTSLMFRDENYINEMRMVRYAESDNWNEVLNMAAANDKPTNTMVFLKNVALMNEGGLLNRSFKLGNIATDITNSDSLHVSLLDIASPIVYYNYGMQDEAIRLNYEKAIQTGFSPFYLKMLSRCALAKGYKKMVERYTTLLHYHPFYGQWQPSSVSTKIKELQNSYVDELSGIENTDSYIVNSISLWYDSDSKVASEQALFYAMLRYDSSRFWPSLRKYLKLHVGEEFPLYAQEAYILFMDKFPEEKRMMIPVEQDVYERYKQFRKALEQRVKPGLTLGKVAKDMRAEWGDTYWYYTFFGRTINLK